MKMTTKLQFDFTVNKEHNTITFQREFAAPQQMVWDAYTKSELLDQWFAPTPLTTKTKSMDFRAGGHWHYAMVEPEGQEHWARLDYKSINPIDGYTAIDGFCDADGILNPELPRSTWDVNFEAKGSHTITKTIISYQSLSDLETIIKMGMEGGLALTLERLDQLLIQLQQ
jgi:uncharacterized protein YndB with AHSA1/START domain